MSSGAESSAALQQSMIYALGMLGVATLFIVAAFKFLPDDEATRMQRARAAGEPDPE